MDKPKPISEKIIAALPAPVSGNHRYYFAGSVLSGKVAPSGFNVCITAAGVVSFALYHRPHNETIGRWDKSPGGGDTTLIAGIIRAKERAAALAKGADPRPVRIRRKEDGAAADGKQTVAQVLARYVERMRKDRGDNFRTLDQVERALNRCVVPRIGKLAAAELGRSDVNDMLDEIADANGAIMADRVLAYFSTAWRWATDRNEKLPLPFTKSMRRTKAADSIRTRVLADDEIRAVWHATAGSEPFDRYARFLLLTAARRSEAAKLPWSEVDIGRGVWSLPAARHKVKTDLQRPLSKLALRQLVPNGEPLVFDFTNGTLTRGLRKIWEVSGTAGWQLHDLRRSARTMLSRAGVATEVAERALGHRPPTIEQTYNQYGFDAELQLAYEKLAVLVEQITEPKENVVALRGRS